MSSSPDRAAADRVAVVVGEVLLGLVGVRASGSPTTGLGWAMLASVFTWGVPYAVVLDGVRRGRVGDRFIAERRQRIGPMVLAVVSAGVGLVALTRLGAPRDLVLVVVAVLAGLVVSLGITAAWKLSVHVAGLAGALAVVTVLYGPWGIGGIPVLALLGWARVRLGAHSLAQVLAGAVVGAAVVGATLARMR